MNTFRREAETSPSILAVIPDRDIHQEVCALTLLLDALLGALASVTHEREAAAPAGVEWLLPLALATVELEYAVRHGAHLDLLIVAHACGDVRNCLDEDRPQIQHPTFAARYAAERASSIRVARMHEAALEACKRVSVLTDTQPHRRFNGLTASPGSHSRSTSVRTVSDTKARKQ
jgi:hypothetical protein